jgi:integration host factor subunit beta
MIKSQLIEAVALENPQFSAAEVDQAVNEVFEAISRQLEKGGRVELRGFGAFSVRSRSARKGRNPRTGEAVGVDAKGVPFFRCGKELHERINGAEGVS